jgi:tRNA dimethylallyltransferase
MDDALPVPCLIGPTAVGKSGVAVELARALVGEVISADAYCAYAGMRILTAAPEAPPDVPHHLVGHLDPSGHWSAADFQQRADELVAEIRSRGKRPLIVGGTALYVRAWLKGFGAPVPRDESLREKLRQLAADKGPEALHARLAEADPTRAANLHPNDIRRVIRALEITQLTGRPASEQRGEWTGPDRQPAIVIRLARQPDDLEDRIQRRTVQMFEQGVVAEAEALLTSPLSAEARQVLGLAELEALIAEELSEDAAKARIAQRTRQFARKQATFFRSFEDAHDLEIEPDEPDASVAARIQQLLRDA